MMISIFWRVEEGSLAAQLKCDLKNFVTEFAYATEKA